MIGTQWMLLENVTIGGIPVTTASRKELTEAFIHDAAAHRQSPRRARLVFDANGHAISNFHTDVVYREAMRSADIIHADGGSIVTASRLLTRSRIRERSATTDMIHDFAAAAQADGLRFFLLGGSEGVNRQCAEILSERYPNLIAGRRNGFFDDQDEQDVIEQINNSGAHIVWVGLGKPKEQIFSSRNSRKFNAVWVVTCGGCFNYITGEYKRAPKWMQIYNMEWIHRMLTRPKQLLWRYVSTTPLAIILMLMKSGTRN